MAKISGILKDGAGQIINDCTIELYAKKRQIMYWCKLKRLLLQVMVNIQ